MSTGTEDGGGVTRVGDRCFLMANSHVGHDCAVGNDVTLANGAVLGGHVTIGDHVFVGGNSAVHQFVRVGEGAMLGGMSGITRDIIPFGFAFGPKADLVGLNMVGLKRRGQPRRHASPAARLSHACSLVQARSSSAAGPGPSNSPATRWSARS